MRPSTGPPSSRLGPLVTLSMFLTALPALAADTVGAGQLPEATILQGTVTITTTGNGKFTYISMPPKALGAPLSAAFVVSFAHPSDSPIKFEGEAELIYDGRLLVVIPSQGQGWVFRLDLMHSVLPAAAHPGRESNGPPKAGGSLLPTVPAKVVAIEQRWWERDDSPFPTTHDEFVKWHQQLLRNVGRPAGTD
jgi:hypothetical protein